ncbi:MAG: SDR family oxidoreductase [Actinobacteria bacterium]|nr:SDR family oxidoreductase [Actinomycetota bacterium]
MDLGLKGRTALVAAASKGLGHACALALAGEGARVAICARDSGALNATRDEIAEATGVEVVAIPADVSTAEGAVEFVRQGAEALGGCEILVPNAGGPRPGRFDDLTDDDFQAAFELNFQSTLRMTREALSHMRSAGYGRIVVIGSMSMAMPLPGLMLSNAVRAGVAGWAKTLANELAPEGITVNVVLPDRIDTDRTRSLAGSEEGLRALARDIPMGRLGEPSDVGNLVAYLAGERAGYLTGGFYRVDGGRYPGLF